MSSPNLSWKALRSRLEEELDREDFETWFGPLSLAREGEQRIVLIAPNEHFVHTL